MYQQRMPATIGRRWAKRLSLLSLLLIGGWLLSACSSGGSDSTSATGGGPETGEVLITLTDAEGDFVTYTVGVASITLEHSDGRIVETLPNEATLDFAQYVNLTELFTAAQVPNGTYVGGSITLDYTAADIQVEVDGAAVPATVTDENGDPLDVYTLDVKLEDQHRLIVAPGRPALLTIDFDLAASHRVDTSTPVPTVVAAPFLVADIEPVDEKDLRVRGPLIDVNIDELYYTVRLRPWHRRDGDFGRAKVNINDATEFEVDGESFMGADGLRALGALGQGAPTVALGTLVTADREFTAGQVYAGDSVPGDRFDAVFGNVTAREENVLTVRGATIVRRSGSVVFNDDVKITISENTIVKKPGQPDANQGIKAVSVGQRVIVFGEVTSNPAFPGIEMDATNGRIRMRYTRLTGRALSVVPGQQLNMELLGIDHRRVKLFDFSGTGMTPELDANPNDYEVATGSLNTDFVIPQTPVRVIGFVNPFGEAPPDFEGRTVVDVALARAILGVGWGSGTTAPFVMMDSTGLVIDLENPDLGERHHIKLGDVIIDLKELPASPTIIGMEQGRRRFAILQGHRVQVFRDFDRFVATLTELLDGSTLMRSMFAQGAYDTVNNVVDASIIGVHLSTPQIDNAE